MTIVIGHTYSVSLLRFYQQPTRTTKEYTTTYLEKYFFQGSSKEYFTSILF